MCITRRWLIDGRDRSRRSGAWSVESAAYSRFAAVCEPAARQSVRNITGSAQSSRHLTTATAFLLSHVTCANRSLFKRWNTVTFQLFLVPCNSFFISKTIQVFYVNYKWLHVFCVNYCNFEVKLFILKVSAFFCQLSTLD